MSIKSESPEKVIEDGLFQKDIGYKDEREWRIIKFGDYLGNEGIEISWLYNEIMGVKVEAIYLGMNISSDIKKKIFDIANEEKIPVYSVVVVENGLLKSNAIDF